MSAPVDVSLSVSLWKPVGLLTFFGAVGPLLATITCFGGRFAMFETVGTVPDEAIFFLIKNVS